MNIQDLLTDAGISLAMTSLLLYAGKLLKHKPTQLPEGLVAVEEVPEPCKTSVVLEVRGHWADGHMTITYGKLDTAGNLIYVEGHPMRKICCLAIDKAYKVRDENGEVVLINLPRQAELVNIPTDQVISPLPEYWVDYLLRRQEARF